MVDVNYIYTITAQRYVNLKKASGQAVNSRTFGWFQTQEEALRVVEIDSGFLFHECSYMYLVVEKVGSGYLSLTECEWWYKWNLIKKRWDKIEKPKCLTGVINFAMG